MLPIIRKTSDSWMPDIFNDFFDNSWMERPMYTAPAINVMENEKEYDVELAAPGLDKEDFKVHVDADNNLHIEMEKKTENKEGKKNGRYLRREFSYEKFQQTLLLPDDVDAEKIEAKVEHGVLNVLLPKLEKIEKPSPIKQISVQ
jgi:HSP20 family protein